MREKNIRQIFQAGIFLKALSSALEIASGILLIFSAQMAHIIARLAQAELLEDPGDLVANAARHYLPYLTGSSQIFAVYYLLSHGIIKLFLAVALLRQKLWAYPASIALFLVFIFYQIYRYQTFPSVALLLLTFFDIVVVALTWHEYKILKKIKAESF